LFRATRTVMSIHNIGYQGWFDAATTYDVGGNVWDLLAPETRAGGGFNWLREGVRSADAVTTVSPTYAKEIATPLGGHGLDAVLRARPDGVIGILNGVDYTEWNPATDRYLKHHYSLQDSSGKAQGKRAFLDWLNLPVDANAPLLGMVTRLTVQKGIDLLFDALPEIITTRDLSCVVLGSGEARYESFFTGLQQRFPDRVVFHRGYNDELAHLIEAGSDMFLMPSLYEPCGLNQMYSMRYGTVPIVRATGGLDDTVQQFNPADGSGTGFKFGPYEAGALLEKIREALYFYGRPEHWQKIQHNGMLVDNSWAAAAKKYIHLYQELTEL
jgi:starch synthase